MKSTQANSQESKDPQEKSSLLVPLILSILVFFASLVATVTFWFNYRENLQEQAQTKFENETARISSLISTRFTRYEVALRGAQGLFAVSEEITRDQWKKYVNTLDISKNFPGILAFAYVQLVTAQEKLNHTKQIQGQGFANYEIKPPGDRELYAPVIYLEPFSGANLEAFGFDIFSEKTRRISLEKARDTGSVSLTDRIILVQEKDSPQEQSGFLISLPVYKHNVALESPDQRQSAITGFVNAPIRIEDFLRKILEEEEEEEDISVEIYDFHVADNLQEDKKIFASKNTISGEKFILAKTIDVADNQWIINFSGPKEFGLNKSETNQPILILAGGIFFSLVLSFSFLLVSSSRQRALRLANSITLDLKKSAEDQKKLIDSLPDLIFRIAKDGTFLEARASSEDLFLFPPKQFLGKKIAEVMPQEITTLTMKAIAQTLSTGNIQSFEYLLTLNGKPMYWEARVNKLNNEEVLLVTRNVTERKVAEFNLKSKTAEFERMNKIMIDRELKMVEMKVEIKKLKGTPQNE